MDTSEADESFHAVGEDPGGAMAVERTDRLPAGSDTGEETAEKSAEEPPEESADDLDVPPFLRGFDS